MDKDIEKSKATRRSWER